jgi:hypothetical protein
MTPVKLPQDLVHTSNRLLSDLKPGESAVDYLV